MLQQIQDAPDALRGPGRPPIGPHVNFRVPVEIKEGVEQEATDRGVKAADVWREVVERGWAKYRRVSR